MTLRFDTRLFTLAKDPEHTEGFQDACCLDAERHVAAIADGVSSALFSGPWAVILADAAVADGPDPRNGEQFAAWLRQQRLRWQAGIDTTSLAWFQKAKLPQGAFSTLLCVRILPGDVAQSGSFGGYRLSAFAAGDSCLFQVRGGELVRSFPLERAEQFEADPIVLGSIDLKRDHLLEFAFLEEMCYPGDELVLCTDAVAEWAARGYESGDPPVWADFWKMSEGDWQSGVAWLRQERQMRIDDATMLIIRVVEEHAPLSAGCPRPASEYAGHGNRQVDASQAADGEDDASLGWISAASKDLKSISQEMAEQADQASERVIRGLRSLKERALQKYRESFKKDKKPRK
jgi:hypothetical protein